MGAPGSMGGADSFRAYLEGLGRGVLGSLPPGPSVTKRCSMKDLFTEQEEWRPIPGYESRYEVSSQGRIRSLLWDRPRILRQCLCGKGYPKVILVHEDGGHSNEMTHRLVLFAFKGAPPAGKPCALHWDGSMTNNALANLRWGSYLENSSDARRHGTELKGEDRWNAKLTEADVRQIRHKVLDGLTDIEISKVFSVNPSNIWSIRRGKSWGWVK